MLTSARQKHHKAVSPSIIGLEAEEKKGKVIMKLRKVFSLFAAAALCVSLAACGNGDSAGSNPPSGNNSNPPSGNSQSVGDVTLPKNIEVQVPASAGGGTDVVSRALTTYINQNSDSNMTVVNNNDGGGVVAYETARTAKADGSTILFFHSTICIKSATGLYDKSINDFKVIAAGLPEDPGGYVLVVPSDSGITDVDGFISAAKDAGGSMMIGVETGGSSHIMSGIMSGALGIELNYVEAGPDTEKLTALVGGSINCALVNPNQAKQYIEAGKVNALACFSSSDEGGRGTVLPDVPSFKELGYDCVFGTYFYVLANPEMDDATAKAIGDLFTAAATDPDTHEILMGTGMAMDFVPYEEAAGIASAQQEALTKACADLGLAG